jgi:hypothetical protein
MPLGREYATIMVELAVVLTSAGYDIAQFRLEQALARLVRTPDSPSIAASFGGSHCVVDGMALYIALQRFFCGIHGMKRSIETVVKNVRKHTATSLRNAHFSR